MNHHAPERTEEPSAPGGGAQLLAVSAVVIVAMLILAAHFLRAGWLAVVVVLVALTPLVGLRRPWVPRVFQAILGLGALEWLRALLVLRDMRLALGEPATRMVLILGGVSIFTALAAASFELPRVRRWYRTTDAHTADDA